MLPRGVIPFFQPLDRLKASSAMRPLIVQVSRDRELSYLRAKLLTTAGHSVVSISPEELAAECRNLETSRVWVFCHTVEFYELAVMALTIRNVKPADKLLRMAGLEDVGLDPGLFDSLLEPITGVDGLLRAVADLSTS